MVYSLAQLLRDETTNQHFDLVIGSYVLGEFRHEVERLEHVFRLWQLTAPGGMLVRPPSSLLESSLERSGVDRPIGGYLGGWSPSIAGRRQVLVGPGTPTGFTQIVAAREAVLQREWELAKASRRKRKRGEQKGAVEDGSAAEDPMTVALEAQQQMGAYVVTPCPHDRPCPLTLMKEYSTRWCYFTQRSERTRLQQLTKVRSRTGRTSGTVLVVRHPLCQGDTALR